MDKMDAVFDAAGAFLAIHNRKTTRLKDSQRVCLWIRNINNPIMVKKYHFISNW